MEGGRQRQITEEVNGTERRRVEGKLEIVVKDCRVKITRKRVEKGWKWESWRTY